MNGSSYYNHQLFLSVHVTYLVPKLMWLDVIWLEPAYSLYKIVYQCTKFEVYVVKPSRVIGCKSCGRHTVLLTCTKQYALPSSKCYTWGLNSTCLFFMEVWVTEGLRVNFVMHEALFEIYMWILCLSYLHEKQTSRIQSLYLFFVKIVPFWLWNIHF